MGSIFCKNHGCCIYWFKISRSTFYSNNFWHKNSHIIALKKLIKISLIQKKKKKNPNFNSQIYIKTHRLWYFSPLSNKSKHSRRITPGALKLNYSQFIALMTRLPNVCRGERNLEIISRMQWKSISNAQHFILKPAPQILYSSLMMLWASSAFCLNILNFSSNLHFSFLCEFFFWSFSEKFLIINIQCSPH